MREADIDDSPAAAALFGFLAGVLAEMAERIVRLETHASEMIGSSPRRSELLVVLQDFDLVRQMMDDCARLCTAASREGDGTLRNLAQLLHLEALRTRLLQVSHTEIPRGRSGTDAVAANGTVDLFGPG